MYSFDPFRNNITPDELASFMRQNFPLVVFDQNMSIAELRALAQKWIDIATHASAQINKAPSASKLQPSRRKRRNGDAGLPTERGKIDAKDRVSGSIKRSRKGAESTEAKDGGIKVNTKPATSTPRNNPSRASKSEASSRTTFMYSLTDRRGTRRSSKPSATTSNSKTKSKTSTNQTQSAKADDPQINDSSSLTGLSDDEDTVARELEDLQSGPPKPEFDGLSDDTFLREVEKLSSGPPKPEFDGLSDDTFLREVEKLSSGPPRRVAKRTAKRAAAEENLIEGLSNDSNSMDARIEKDLIDLGPMDVFQLPNVGDIKGSIAGEVVEPHFSRPSNTSCTCNLSCQQEISTLKARIEKLEDLTFPQYRIPPPSVAILKEYDCL